MKYASLERYVLHETIQEQKINSPQEVENVCSLGIRLVRSLESV